MSVVYDCGISSHHIYLTFNIRILYQSIYALIFAWSMTSISDWPMKL